MKGIKKFSTESLDIASPTNKWFVGVEGISDIKGISIDEMQQHGHIWQQNISEKSQFSWK